MKILKFLIVLSILGSPALLIIVSYPPASWREKLEKENKIPRETWEGRYENAKYVSAVINKERFTHLQEKYPRIAAFIVGLDPSANKLAWYRWGAIAQLGWIHFCYFSFLTSGLSAAGISRTNLLIFPYCVGFFMAFLNAIIGFILSPGPLKVHPYQSTIENIFIIVIAIGAVPFLLVGLFSIPISIGRTLFKITRETYRTGLGLACGAWSLGERFFGVPKSGFPLKVHNYVLRYQALARARIKTNQQETKEVKPPAELPLPVVKRVEINGAKYDV